MLTHDCNKLVSFLRFFLFPFSLVPSCFSSYISLAPYTKKYKLPTSCTLKRFSLNYRPMSSYCQGHIPGADKSLARPGRKQARKHVRDARDFNNIETRAVIKFFSPARQDAEGNSRHSDRNISLFPSWSG